MCLLDSSLLIHNFLTCCSFWPGNMKVDDFIKFFVGLGLNENCENQMFRVTVFAADNIMR